MPTLLLSGERELYKKIIRGKECWLGRGEILVKNLLLELLPGCYIEQQMNLTEIIPLEEPSKRQIKETIDIYVEYKIQKIAVRIQNNKGELKMLAESVQKQELERNGIIVVDINEYQSPNVFAEKINYMTYLEICYPLFKQGVKP